MIDPGKIIAAGDWHGNLPWALDVIRAAPAALAGERCPLILHFGDFGIWPGRDAALYLLEIDTALRDRDMELWFIDGNHEDFTQIERFPVWSHGRAEVTPRIWHLPRGHRWQWHGRTWLACGGGVSLDKAIRTEGVDWWPQEEITAGQEAAIIAAGPADVLVSHDCPAGVVHTYPPPPKFWDRTDLARSDAHQARLQRITDTVRPAHIMHGHLHMGYQRVCDFGYGPVEVTGLNCDGGEGGSRWATGPNWLILDTRTMKWELPGVSRSRPSTPW